MGDPQRPAEVADGAGEPAVEQQQRRCPEIHGVSDAIGDRQMRLRRLATDSSHDLYGAFPVK